MPEESLNKINKIFEWLFKTKNPEDIIYFNPADPNHRKNLYNQTKKLLQKTTKPNDNDKMENGNDKYDKNASVFNTIFDPRATYINVIKQNPYYNITTYKP